jgi:hypothetical protein
MTRIKGCGTIGWGTYRMIPVGGKSVLAASDTLTAKLATLIRALAHEYERDRSNTVLRDVFMGLEELMSRVDMVVMRAGMAHAEGGGPRREAFLAARPSFASRFMKAASVSFEKMLDFATLETGYVAGSLLIVPLAGKALQETHEMRLGYELKRCREGALLRQMLAIRMNKRYPDSIRSVIGDAIDLVDLLREPADLTQRVEQSSVRDDQYYTLPLYALCVPTVLEAYFAHDREAEETETSRDILFGYARELYSIEGILPIGHRYAEFPFAVFRSYSLREARRTVFTDRYLLASTELNVLNVILSQER